MNDFKIITDSCSDLGKELRTQYDVEYIPMHMSLEGKQYAASLDWEDFSAALRETNFDGVLSLECLPKGELVGDIEEEYALFGKIAKAVRDGNK